LGFSDTDQRGAVLLWWHWTVWISGSIVACAGFVESAAVRPLFIAGGGGANKMSAAISGVTFNHYTQS